MDANKDTTCNIQIDAHDINASANKHNSCLDLQNNIISSETASKGTNGGQWIWCGDTLPKDQIVFFIQIIPIYIVICCSIANLMLGRGDDHIWLVLLSSSLGYLLPNPKISRNKR